MVKPTDYVHPEGSKNIPTRRSGMYNHRGQRAGHAHKGQSSELRRSV